MRTLKKWNKFASAFQILRKIAFVLKIPHNEISDRMEIGPCMKVIEREREIGREGSIEILEYLIFKKILYCATSAESRQFKTSAKFTAKNRDKSESKRRRVAGKVNASYTRR